MWRVSLDTEYMFREALSEVNGNDTIPFDEYTMSDKIYYVNYLIWRLRI